MSDELATRLAKNIRQLRDAQGLTQQQMATLSALPRATWANLESGSANPTLAVLHKVAAALRVSIEELIAVPRAECEYYPAASLPVRTKGRVSARRLLPDPIPGMELDRLELPQGTRFTGAPHTPGTREYLTCETGELTLHAAGETWVLRPGDVVVFRGDQHHSYVNSGTGAAIGYSVVMLVPRG